MSPEKPIHTIVLDTGPILQNNPSVSTLVSKSESLVTTPTVISEIKDRKTRHLLETSLQPFLVIKTPSLLSSRFVTDFARKTGDLAALSQTDVEIIALAYELDCERNEGDSRLRKVPGQKRLNGSSPNNVLDAQRESKAAPIKSGVAKIPTTAAPWAKIRGSPPILEPESPESAERELQVDEDNNYIKASEILVDQITRSADNLCIDNANPEPDSTVASSHEFSLESTSPTHGPDNSESEDSEGWITPSNIGKFQTAQDKSLTSTISSETTMQVAIMTADFAMQNVILQIGLNLLSPNFQRIRNIRTYVLRCHACFQTVKDTSKEFCPRCGNPTLTRVSCSTNAKGEFRIHLKKNMQWNHRGDRYSIPKPVPGQANGKVGQGKGGGKGGWGQELIFSEDQKEYQRATGTNRREKGANLMDEDHLPGILTGDRRKAGGRPKVGAGRNVNSKKRF